MIVTACGGKASHCCHNLWHDSWWLWVIKWRSENIYIYFLPLLCKQTDGKCVEVRRRLMDADFSLCTREIKGAWCEHDVRSHLCYFQLQIWGGGWGRLGWGLFPAYVRFQRRLFNAEEWYFTSLWVKGCVFKKGNTATHCILDAVIDYNNHFRGRNYKRMAMAISQVQRWHLVRPGSREAMISYQMVPFFALNV